MLQTMDVWSTNTSEEENSFNTFSSCVPHSPNLVEVKTIEASSPEAVHYFVYYSNTEISLTLKCLSPTQGPKSSKALWGNYSHMRDALRISHRRFRWWKKGTLKIRSFGKKSLFANFWDVILDRATSVMSQKANINIFTAVNLTSLQASVQLFAMNWGSDKSPPTNFKVSSGIRLPKFKFSFVGVLDLACHRLWRVKNRQKEHDTRTSDISVIIGKRVHACYRPWF